MTAREIESAVEAYGDARSRAAEAWCNRDSHKAHAAEDRAADLLATIMREIERRVTNSR